MFRFFMALGLGLAVFGTAIAEASGKAQKCAAEVEKARDMPYLGQGRGGQEASNRMLDKAADAAKEGKGKKCEKILAKAIDKLNGN